ncbi:hypothetical protein CDG77_17870 [Nostoc sp. 'Peltigera membranacea cyanobiont' 213]|uniref:NB-ARC domain-containing protein n=1 Tax=Nostoc sp. 'Peltigera membranacea cyanobiont' 213 TaxID=2014530 RepID=UPI000B95C234|nr:NB-ARC domain-containing protein [Nostoc sp. 'Peltigera membranacea cyanobiont' 213]OYD89881.1 hypothetical protein CDG77_17870 [Nostoc sp. 'Peltigera membranacea cyanobiont' 213]
MARVSYGDGVKARVRLLLERFLAYANDELENRERFKIALSWETSKQVVVRTQLQVLAELSGLTKEQVREALNRLVDFLGILEDLREHKLGSGSADWHFRLTFWDDKGNKDGNLKKFDEEWQRCREKLLGFQRNERKAKLTHTYYENIPLSGVVQFIGRENELQTLHQLLLQNNQVAIVAIIGMGGVGKTELALQYAITHRETYKGGICWLLPKFGDVGVQIVQFARTHLDLNPPEDLDLPVQVQYCWRRWREGEVLLVLDYVTDYREVKPYLPTFSSQFKVLITTRQQLGLIAKLSLDVLQPEAALELLKSLLKETPERVERELAVANQLCEWLGYLPLGLELVGCYLARRPDLSLAQMLRRLEEKGLNHVSLNQPKAEITAELGIAASLELSWKELDNQTQQLGCLLSMFALSPIFWSEVEEVIRRYIYLQNEGFSPDELEDVRGNLIALHLLERINESTYRLHSLVQKFLRDKLEDLPQGIELKQAFANTKFNFRRATTLYFNALLKIVPDILPIGGESEVVVCLSPTNINDSKAYVLEVSEIETVGDELNIFINAPGFQFNSNNTTSLPLDSDTANITQIASFNLTALRPGITKIKAEFYCGDTYKTTLETEVEVTAGSNAKM